ncbi:MAG: hypothetical protein P1V35_05125 [Planctomycetota bacterium]|nr:hypothetical protein [Planctomycetota bacterium]
MSFPTRIRLLPILAIWLSASCCVTTPKPKEVLAYGFDTPIQAFQSFVVALRSDLPHYEYRCFSTEFKARNEISRGGYLMFRDELLKEEPLLRWALQKASRKPEHYQLKMGPDGQRALLTVDVSGTPLTVLLARESYVSVKGQPEDPMGSAELWVDKTVGSLEREQWLFPMPSGTLGAQAPNPNRDLDRLISMTIGREWKIEDISIGGAVQP